MTNEQVQALIEAAQAAREQLILILLINSRRAVRKGEIEHSQTLHKLHTALAPFEAES